jgi:hypothetical protein
VNLRFVIEIANAEDLVFFKKKKVLPIFSRSPDVLPGGTIPSKSQWGGAQLSEFWDIREDKLTPTCLRSKEGSL